MTAAPLPVLAAQAFAGGQLLRGLGSRTLRDIASSPSAQFLLVAERRACLTDAVPPQLRWFDPPALSALGLSLAADGEQLASQHGATAPLYFLGAHADERFALAADITELLAHNALPQGGLVLQDLRTCMATLPSADLAIAGHAVALSQWHQAHRFCPRCGAPTAPAAAGAKRQCSTVAVHTLYPRTDPVVIMLVQSPDGGRALLGRSHKIPEGMLTCLSGFVDQGESIEEAVAREVHEEAGARVTGVSIIGSQPWPLGRGGSHELMIGAVATAAGEELHVDYTEMAECRWVSRAEVKQALEQSTSPGSPYVSRRSAPAGTEAAPLPPPGFYVPPPLAIAHHLMKAWAEGSVGAPRQHCNM